MNFNDATTYYKVSTVNYLAAGSCNFNDGGVTLWPLNQILNDTQYYVRDAVIDYVRANSPPSRRPSRARISHVAVPGPEGTLGTQIMLTGPGFGNKKGKVLIGGVAAEEVTVGTIPPSFVRSKRSCPPGRTTSWSFQRNRRAPTQSP